MASAYKMVQESIKEHKEMLEKWEQRPAWYRNSTGGRNEKMKYLYTLDCLYKIQKACLGRTDI